MSSFMYKIQFLSQSIAPTVADPVPTPLSATKPCPPPPPPPTAAAIQPDQLNMIGLHNIFLIAPGPSFNPPIIPSPPLQIPNLGSDQQESACPRKEYSLNNGGDFDTSSRVCKDCGNRAKKECEFRRCRTCCKSRSFNCSTHVKSTWIPAARRKELRRFGGGGGDGTSATNSGGGIKRPRENWATTCNNSFSTCDNFQDRSFKQSLPRQVEAAAAFKCVRVKAINGGEAEVAYQAMVNIRGHVFKGFLYNQGLDDNNIYPKIPSDSTGTNRDSNS